MSTSPETQTLPALEARFARLERRLRRTQKVAALALLGLVSLFTMALAAPPPQSEELAHLRVRRLDVVDDAGVVRVSIGQDPKDTQRRSRSAGLTIHDGTGAERGGLATMDDGSVVFALDAPAGVGAPMRDRLGLRVDSDGSCHVMLLDNQTRAVAKLYSDGKGGGGVQVFKWDMEAKKIHVKTQTYDGPVHETLAMGN